MKKPLFIVSAIVVLIFIVYQGLILVDNYFPFGRMKETPAIKPLERESLLMEEGSVPLSGGEAIYRATKSEDLKSPIVKSDLDSIKKGEALYAIYCAQCHGKNHDGNGTVGQSFFPLPTDLRNNTVQTSSEGLLFKHISYGVVDGRQPPLASTISVMNRWVIISYIKSLGVR